VLKTQICVTRPQCVNLIPTVVMTTTMMIMMIMIMIMMMIIIIIQTHYTFDHNKEYLL